MAILRQNGRDQQRITQHILPIQVVTGGVVGKFQDHGPQHRHPRLV